MTRRPAPTDDDLMASIARIPADACPRCSGGDVENRLCDGCDNELSHAADVLRHVTHRAIWEDEGDDL